MATNEEEFEEKIRLKDVLMGAGGAIPLLVPLELLGLGQAGMILGAAGGICGYLWGEDIVSFTRKHLATQDAQGIGQWLMSKGGPIKTTKARHQAQSDQEEETAQPAPDELITDTTAPAEHQAIFASDEPRNDPGIRRITVNEMVEHVARNSYEVYIGRSLTRPGNKAIKINFHKRHIKLIGASQHGKSSMAAALIEAIMRTHDPEKVMFALLDLENKTSRLFAESDHIAEICIDGKYIPLHARSPQEVLQHLEYLLQLVEYRYGLSEQEIDELPLLIAYLEEFLELKDFFKICILEAKNKDQEEAAKKDYERLLHCIRKIARMGLKVHVQLLMCAQVDYADDDLKEALANITSGMAFCVKPSAARSAGFLQEKLMAQNAKDDKVGQCVVEMPECKDLILAPYYPLRDKLKALGKDVLSIHHSPVLSQIERTRLPENTVKVNAENVVNALEKRVNASENAGEHSPTPENVLPEYSQSEEVQVLLAWGELQRSDKPVTRTSLMEYLGWNRKQYTRIVKPVCDKHHILVTE